MRYFSTRTATDFPVATWQGRFISRLLFFIPRASPDFEARYCEVRCWLVEVDDNGQTRREVGLREDGDPVVAAPWGRNLGFWTDLEGQPPADQLIEISREAFQAAWDWFAADTDIPIEE